MADLGRSEVAREIIQLRDKILTSIEEEPARYQTDVSTAIKVFMNYLTLLARIRELQIESMEAKSRRSV